MPCIAQSNVMVQRKYEDALPVFERNLGILEAVHGPEHPGVAESLDFQGWILYCQVTMTWRQEQYEHGRASGVGRAMGEKHGRVVGVVR